MTDKIKKMRNIGISAHIDSGKTTLTERILFYCEKIHAIHEVHDKQGSGATMDSMELERERGITIASAATSVRWKNHDINIIDTPGHIDFTIEVERALRVLDGAILVLDVVGGVQSQTITVDRQLRRNEVPFIAFANKCDRVGADPRHLPAQIETQLGRQAVMAQLPIGTEANFIGVVDLVSMRAIYFEGQYGAEVRNADIPQELQAEAEQMRDRLIDVASLHSDELAAAYLEGEVPDQVLHDAIRVGVLSGKMLPLFLGSAYKNRGVQTLLDAVLNYLPTPLDRSYHAFSSDDSERRVPLSAHLDPQSGAQSVSLAFKLEESQYGQLTYIRIYQGTVKKGMELQNSRNGRRFRVGRLIRMHADAMEEISEGGPGDIIAIFGIECASGDTFCSQGELLTMTSMHVPEPVISLAIKPLDKQSETAISKALGRFTREDPTFRTHIDEESNETIVQGMGELHLEVYLERMRREYQAKVESGAPRVAYRETITRQATFDYQHKKQTGGAGQFGRVAGFIEPLAEGAYEFVNHIRGASIPNEYIPSCDKGFRTAIRKGGLAGFPIIGVRVTIEDGSTHAVDSSDIAFQQAAIGAFRQAYHSSVPKILEPIMEVTVETPQDFQGSVFGSISQRRGVVISSTDNGNYSTLKAEAPLAEMFGYSTHLRSLTQGRADFSMEFSKYSQVPQGVSKQLQEERSKKGSKGNG